MTCNHEWYQSIPGTESELWKSGVSRRIGMVKCMRCGVDGSKSTDEYGNVHVIWSSISLDTSEDLINQLETIRAKNNKSWMNLVRLAFKHAPDEARDIMKSIVEYDSQIGIITKQLSEE